MSEAIQSEAIQGEAMQTEQVRSKPVHPVDEILPLPKLFALGLQHVLVMYANAVAVPLIIGGALYLPKDQMAMLINADLFACGIATLIQTVGFGPFGIRLPIIMGVTAVSISPMLAMAAMPGVGLTGIYGAVLVGGIFGLCVAPFVKYVLRFFPAVVTGTIITMIGVVLMRVGVNWAGGGAGKADFGAAGYLAVAALVLAVILLVIKFTRGFLQNVAVLIGITVGYLLTIALGWTDFSGIAEEPIVRVVMPLQFGMPQFFLIPSLTMCLVVMIVFIEATGMFLALGAMTGRKVDADDVKRGLRADSLGTVIGAIFQHLPLRVLLAEYRARRRHRRLQPLGLRRRRRHHAGARPHPEARLHCRLGAAMRARRRRLHHVRHGGGDRHQDSGDRRLRQSAP
jgi:uric acid transporter